MIGPHFFAVFSFDALSVLERGKMLPIGAVRARLTGTTGRNCVNSLCSKNQPEITIVAAYPAPSVIPPSWLAKSMVTATWKSIFRNVLLVRCMLHAADDTFCYD
jgi:hypothetical protein